MSQSHLTLDFPITSPADAKALAEELPPLMSDLAKAQGDVGTVHFSRFMVAGDEKLLFPSNVDGDAEGHNIERLLERAGPVFDAIFKHVEDPPATPVANNSAAVSKWLKQHNHVSIAPYSAFEEASVRDIKGAARAAGFTDHTQQNTFLTYMSAKSGPEALALKQASSALQDKARKGSGSIGTLHFSHWVLFENNCIAFFTIYDGDFEKYIQDFADQIGHTFDLVFAHISGAPPTPVAKNAKAFLQWAAENNHPAIGFYSAYPGLGVQDIRALLAQVAIEHRCIAVALDGHESGSIKRYLLAKQDKTQVAPAREGEGILRRILGRHEPPKTDADPRAMEKSGLDLADIQGLILRRYRMLMVRHFLLTVGIPAQARRQLRRLVSGDESDVPQITTAEDWHVGFEPGPGDNLTEAPRRKPDYCLNIGITWPGLVALEIRERVPALSFKSFGAFIEGAAQRAELIGDTGAGSPQKWIGAFGKGLDHVLVTLHAISPEAMKSYSDRLSAWFADGNAFQEIWRQDGMALMEMQNGQPVPTSKIHFGYTDGISMTTIRGGPERYRPDHQQPCEPWLFVLREDAENYEVPEPRELGLNGSFAVFKKIETDVVGFETFLQSNKDKIDPELLAAKMCGRWRNGVPLALSPDTDSPAGGIAPEQLDNFEYVNADGSGDPRGIRCPVGAHIRRVNPRGQPIAGQGLPGGSNNSHRLIRRGLPYGPAYDPTKPYDGIERGILFYFINSNIENQYEFVQRRWVNDSEFAGAVRLHPKSKDPLIGTKDPAESIFVIPKANGEPPIEITGLSTFVTTKATTYLFLPSITAIKFIANL